MNKTKVFVLGGTGFLGYYVIRSLYEAGFQLGILLHKRKDDFGVPYSGYQKFEGDISKKESIDSALKRFKPDIVINMAGIIKERHPTATFEKVHTIGTKNLVEAARKNNVKRIIHVSVLGVDKGIDTEYYKTKKQAEEIIKNSKLEWVILRPSVIFGWRSNFASILLKQIQSWPFSPTIGKGNFELQPVAASVVASCITQSSQSNTNSLGKVYDVVGPEKITFLEITRRVKDKANIEGKTIGIPLWMVKIGAKMGDLGLPIPITSTQLYMLLKGSVGDESAMKRDFEVEDIYFDPLGEFPLY